ncbi:MAG TPA: guanylate kinase [Candidatus Limivivens merdigallinarum]|uniref:Guanylate kinase n=1 Tax=Candidatus Limivivens merdigallinarum TaxID=2840859 RepID=A0A9D0ZT87_9FIRM|nr:guanylate kinase [Candidatus Limivivens merdigallinarum]
MNKDGVLIVLSGFSGAGKGTLVKRLMELHEGYALSISATTRAPREGEMESVHYFFKTREEFEQMIEEDAFFEHAEYCGNYYGTPKAYVEEQLSKGRNVILEIEIQGALKIKEQRPDALLLFVTPKDAETLRERLTGRGTESPEVVEQRLSRAGEEAEGVEHYDYLLINDDLDTCVEEMHSIIRDARFRVTRNLGIIDEIKKSLKKGE